MFLTPGVGEVNSTVGVGVKVGVGYMDDCDIIAELAEAASVAFVTLNISGYL